MNLHPCHTCGRSKHGLTHALSPDAEMFATRDGHVIPTLTVCERIGPLPAAYPPPGFPAGSVLVSLDERSVSCKKCRARIVAFPQLRAALAAALRRQNGAAA